MIQGTVLKSLKKYIDERGWLAELFREDELGEIPRPGMSYISMTQAGVCRGPHEHRSQTDFFCFIGPSNFKVVLWDNRKESPTFGQKMTIYAGQDNPTMVVVPPGVVHGYKNIGSESGMVVNLPDKLYKGYGRCEEVDEIRHEDDPASKYKLE